MSSTNTASVSPRVAGARSAIIAGLTAVLALAIAAPLTAQEERERERAERIETRRGWLGFSYDFDSPRTMVIVDVQPGSPAAEAGLRDGDVVLQLNGRAPTPDVMRELRIEAGDRVEVRLERDDREREITIVAAPRPRRIAARDFHVVVPHIEDGDRVIIINDDTVRIGLDSLYVRLDSLHNQLRVFFADSLRQKLRTFQREMPEFEFRFDADSVIVLPEDFDDFEGFQYRDGDGWNFRVAPGAMAFFGHRAVAGAEFTELNADLAEYFGTDEGVLVLKVAPGTPAARAGLEAGDVVVEVNGEEVDNVNDLRREIARLGWEDEGEEIRLRVIRKGQARELELSHAEGAVLWWGR